jgi:OmpA-OmpF porin, OOP family
MKKISLILSLTLLGSQAMAYDNWTSTSGDPVRNSTGLCWRDSSWTPATAHPDCDGALKPVKKVEAPKPVPKAETPVAAPAPKVEAPTPVVTKTTYQAETLFDFDKSVIKPAGKQVLDDLVAKLKNVGVEVIVVVGHTDSIGTDAYNMKLGSRRAEAVKAYLVNKGIEKTRVYTESKGESKPVADNKTAQGRAKNRRVEVEVVGTAKQ